MRSPRERLLRKGDYVHGSFVKPEQVDGYINAVNPGDRSDVLGRFPFSLRNVDDAVEFAGRGARVWRRVPINDRASAVRRLRDLLHANQESLSRLLTRETGKPLWESRQEVVAAVRAVDLFLDDGLGIIAPRVLEEISGRADYLPRGVVGVVCPYNMPVLLGVLFTAAAILGGNAVVVKASKFTPGTGQALAELWDRCKLPRGVFNLVQGSGSVVGQRLVSHPGLDALVFCGSFESARDVRRATQERPELPAFYQCGGKGIAIVLDDAEIERAVYEVLVGAFVSTGQRHNSTGRVIVTEAVFDAFTAALVERTRRLNIGYGMDADVFMGPLISENFRTRFRRYSGALQSRGHTALLEGDQIEVPNYRGNYVRPGVYQVHWDNGHPFLNDEPVGPSLLVYKVRNWEEAVQVHNQAMFRLATSVFTRTDNSLLPEIRDSLRAGAFNVNRGTISSTLRLPTLGLGRSSNGMPGGIELMRFLTYPRASLIEARPFDSEHLVPGLNWNVLEADEEMDTVAG